MKKRLTISKLKKKVWAVFSKYIRLLYSNYTTVKCVTCGTVKPIGEMHAGHYIHGNTKRTYFEERNVHPQCVSCNMYKSGNLAPYAIYLESFYGVGILQELEALGNDQRTWKRDELEELYIIYKHKVSNLEEVV